MRKGIRLVLLFLLPLLAACGTDEPSATVSPTLPAQLEASPSVASIAVPLPSVEPTEANTAVPLAEPSPEPAVSPLPDEPAANVVSATSQPDPALDPQAYLASLAHVPDPNLIGRTWAWERRAQGGEAIIIVPDPENYTLFFEQDGSLSAQVDCNSGSGGYATTPPAEGQPGIFLALGSRTQTQCRSSSLEGLMVQLFGPARTYGTSPDGRQLQLFWDGGVVDTFGLIEAVDLPEPMPGTAVGTVVAASGAFLRSGPGPNYPALGIAAQGDSAEIVGTSADGRWWQAVAPALPGGMVWLRAEFVEVAEPELVPVIRASGITSLVDTPWEWVSTTDPSGVVRVPDPSRYVLRFHEDGSVIIIADCNISLGTTSYEGEAINITLGPATLAHCGPDSLDTDFLYQITSATTAVLEEGSLYLGLPLDEARMRFVPQGSPPPSEETSLEAIIGIPLTLVSSGRPGEEQPPLPGTRITTTFDGSLVNGESGCNTYSGALIPQDSYFTIGPLITTKKDCLEPVGVMEQEQAFLAALQNTSGLQWERVRGGGGEIITNVQTSYTLLNGTARRLELFLRALIAGR